MESQAGVFVFRVRSESISFCSKVSGENGTYIRVDTIFKPSYRVPSGLVRYNELLCVGGKLSIWDWSSPTQPIMHQANSNYCVTEEYCAQELSNSAQNYTLSTCVYQAYLFHVILSYLFYASNPRYSTEETERWT